MENTILRNCSLKRNLILLLFYHCTSIWYRQYSGGKNSILRVRDQVRIPAPPLLFFVTLSKLLNLLVLSSIKHMTILTIKSSENEYKTSVSFLVAWWGLIPVGSSYNRIISFVKENQPSSSSKCGFSVCGSDYLEV